MPVNFRFGTKLATLFTWLVWLRRWRDLWWIAFQISSGDLCFAVTCQKAEINFDALGAPIITFPEGKVFKLYRTQDNGYDYKVWSQTFYPDVRHVIFKNVYLLYAGTQRLVCSNFCGQSTRQFWQICHSHHKLQHTRQTVQGTDLTKFTIQTTSSTASRTSSGLNHVMTWYDAFQITLLWFDSTYLYIYLNWPFNRYLWSDNKVGKYQFQR